jgi:hypothetical protein
VNRRALYSRAVGPHGVPPVNDIIRLAFGVWCLLGIRKGTGEEGDDSKGG